MGSPFTYTVLAIVLSASVNEHVHGWTPGTGNESATSGFSVDRQSRNDVIAFWHAVYKESEGYENRVNWTGLSNGPGTTSALFKGDVQRRINYYRAMAGMSADMDMTSTSKVPVSKSSPLASTTKETAAQAAAYMLTINSDEYRPGGGVVVGADNPHNPPTSWAGVTLTARNGAANSNLAVRYFGPGAIDSYISENDQGAGGVGNVEVGHRRLIFYSRRTEFATGDVPETPSGFAPYLAANALYCSGNILTSASPQFVAWPSAGFFPEPLSTKYWSLSYPGADYSTASVTMTNSSGGAISLSVVSRAAVFGDNSMVWEPVASQIPDADTEDQTINVTISNILINDVLQSYSYSVTMINPDRLLKFPELIGSLSPPDTGGRYFFDPVDHASGYRLQVVTESAGTWLEGAESSTTGAIIDGTTSTYALSNFAAKRTGVRGFHIGLTPENYQLQYVQLDRQLIPASDSELIFWHRKRRMGADTRAKAEISVDDGLTWTELWGFQGDGKYVLGFTQKRVSLASYSGQIINIRFSVEHPGSSSVPYWPVDGSGGGSGDFNGIHIDDIQISGGDMEVVSIVETNYPLVSSQITLDAASAGLTTGLLDTNQSYRLRLQVKLGSQWFPFGSSFNVQPVPASSISSYESWVRGEYFVIGNFDDDFDNDGISNGIEHVFGLDPTDKSDAAAALTPQIVGDHHIQLSHPIVPGESVAAQLSETLKDGSWEDVTVTISGGVATVSVPLSSSASYLRWKVVK